MSNVAHFVILTSTAIAGGEARMIFWKNSRELGSSPDDYWLTVFATGFLVHSILCLFP